MLIISPDLILIVLHNFVSIKYVLTFHYLYGYMLLSLKSVALVSQCSDNGGIGLGQNGNSYNKFLNYFTSLNDASAMNSAALVESAIHVCFLEPQKIVSPLNENIHPLIGA